MDKKNFLNVHDVAKYMDISEPMAYKVIRRLNSELSQKGYITISGKVSKAFFMEKVYCISE